MKAKIFLGPRDSGKTITSNIIASLLPRQEVVKINGRELHNMAIDNSPFLFRQITEKTKLLIIDDLPSDFDYINLYQVYDNSFYGGDVSLTFQVEKQGKSPFTLIIPSVIISTQTLKQKWNNSSFNARFDIIRFPII